MRQTLLRIPLDGPWSLGPLGEVPGFGFGIVLALWVFFGAVWLFINRRKLSAAGDLLSPAGIWIAAAAAILLLPTMVQRPADAAIAEADRALQADPESADALFNRAQARFSKRQYSQAADDLRAALKINPRFEPALTRLAWIQATCPDGSVRDGAAAVSNAEKAGMLTSWQQPNALTTLAAAQAERGDFATAVRTQRRALRLAVETKEPNTAAEVSKMREQLQMYELDRPFRDDTAGKSLPIFGFGAMLFIGFISAAWTAGRRGARIGYSPEVIWDAGIWIFIAGVVGCRVFYCIQYASRIFYNYENGHYVLKSSFNLLLSAVDLPDGGLVYYGGIPAAVLVGAWICRKRGLNLLDLGDIVIPSLFLGMAFGRIGCFLNGCCYGDQCSLPWGVRFPMGSVPDVAMVLRGFVGADQDLSVRLHPTQLYSSLDGFLLYFLTSTFFAYRPRRGAVMALGALTYPLTRFAIESLRADEPGQFHTWLTISQWISIGMFLVGVGFAVWLSRRPKLSSATRFSAPVRPDPARARTA
jgi:phosphatidylglycerol---prolipoprotein diacylglyceryl transferase